MDKAPDAYRTISEVAEDLDLPQHVLRFWETRFTQIKPLKRGGGRRYYRPDDVELLKGIRHLLYKEGYTIKGVQRILKEQGARAVQAFVRESLAAPSVAPAPHASAHVAPAPVATVNPSLEPIRLPPDDHAGWESHPATAGDAADFHPADEETGAATEASVPPIREPTFTPVPAPGQVSMFRGGLARGEGQLPPALPEFAPSESVAPEPGISEAPARESVVPRAEIVRVSRVESRGDASRADLAAVLDELVACRAIIDRVLARKPA